MALLKVETKGEMRVDSWAASMDVMWVVQKVASMVVTTVDQWAPS